MPPPQSQQTQQPAPQPQIVPFEQQIDQAINRQQSGLTPQQAQQLQALQPYLYDYAQNMEEFEQWKQQRQQAQQPTAEQAHQKAHAAAKRHVPNFDESMLDMVTRDDKGNLVPVSEYINPTIVPQVEAYLKWYKNEQSRIVRDPLSVLEEAGIEDRFLKPLNDRISQLEQQIANERNQVAMNQARQEIHGELHRWVQHDQYGRPIMDPNTGDYAFTSDGMLYRWAESQMPKETDPATRHRMAKQYVDMARNAFGQQPNAQPQPAAPQPPPQQSFAPPPPQQSFGQPTNRLNGHFGGTQFTDRVPPRAGHDNEQLVDSGHLSRTSDRFAAVMRGEQPYPGM